MSIPRIAMAKQLAILSAIKINKEIYFQRPHLAIYKNALPYIAWHHVILQKVGQFDKLDSTTGHLYLTRSIFYSQWIIKQSDFCIFIFAIYLPIWGFNHSVHNYRKQKAIIMASSNGLFGVNGQSSAI